MTKAKIIELKHGESLDDPCTIKIDYDAPSLADQVLCTIYYPGSAYSVYAKRDNFAGSSWTAHFPSLLESKGKPVSLRAVPTNAGHASDPAEIKAISRKRDVKESVVDNLRGGYGGSISINAPSPGSSVSVTFLATGTIGNALTNNVAGSITAGGVTYSGTTTIQGPNWQMSFSQPSSASNALLEVWCADDKTVIAQETINIVSDGGSGGAGGGHGHYNVKPPSP
jgi:hypothetical protein